MTIPLSDREKAIVRACLNRKAVATAQANREQQALEELLMIVAERAGGDLEKGFTLSADGNSLVQMGEVPSGNAAVN